MSEVQTFIKQLRLDASTFAQAWDDRAGRVKFWFDRGYNDSCTDEDAQACGLANKAVVDSMITLLQNMAAFYGNSAVTQGDYQATINKMRSDISGTGQ